MKNLDQDIVDSVRSIMYGDDEVLEAVYDLAIMIAKRDGVKFSPQSNRLTLMLEKLMEIDSRSYQAIEEIHHT
jgi:hypothetical protein